MFLKVVIVLVEVMVDGFKYFCLIIFVYVFLFIIVYFLFC